MRGGGHNNSALSNRESGERGADEHSVLSTRLNGGWGARWGIQKMTHMHPTYTASNLHVGLAGGWSTACFWIPAYMHLDPGLHMHLDPGLRMHLDPGLHLGLHMDLNLDQLVAVAGAGFPVTSNPPHHTVAWIWTWIHWHQKDQIMIMTVYISPRRPPRHDDES